MRFLTLVKAIQDPKPGIRPEKLITTTRAKLPKAGAWLDVSRRQSNPKGWRHRRSGGYRSFIDGPFAETKELIVGYEIPDQQPGSRQRDGYAQRPRRGPRCRAIG
jgi:hypothetical protein